MRRRPGGYPVGKEAAPPAARTVTERRFALDTAPLEDLRRHAAETYPEECCGFLLGRAAPEGAVVERALAADNEHPSARGTRYLIPPERVLAARREARALELRIVGYYHSHPDRSAEPSRHDLDDAWPGLSYLIVPVAGGVAGRPRSWRLREDARGFEEELVVPGDPREEAVSPPPGIVAGGRDESLEDTTRGGSPG